MSDEPVVTICTDLPINPKTAEALGEMVKLVTKMAGNPRCPRCRSLNVIEPGERYPNIWTCDPCGYDFEPHQQPARDDAPMAGDAASLER